MLCQPWQGYAETRTRFQFSLDKLVMATVRLRSQPVKSFYSIWLSGFLIPVLILLMELYHLRSFLMVANEGRLTRAAQRLFTSQPAVSAHIKALEDELGLSLFRRTPQGMELSQEGEFLKTYAEKCLTSVNDFVSAAKHLRQEFVGRLNIGLNTAPETLRAGELLAVMAANYPQIEFHLYQRNSWKMAEALQVGELDAGYMFGEVKSPEIKTVPLRTCYLRIVAPLKWQTQLAGADWKELASYPWIGVPELCPFHRVIADIFAQRRLTLNIVAVGDQEAMLSNLVRAGIGLSVMIEEEALDAQQQGLLWIWERERLPISLSFSYMQHREQEPAIQALLSGLHQVEQIHH